MRHRVGSFFVGGGDVAGVLVFAVRADKAEMFADWEFVVRQVQLFLALLALKLHGRCFPF
jgi:hypothetical protein